MSDDGTSKRVVLCGAPLAGKTEILKRVAAARGGVFDRFSVPGTAAGTGYSLTRARFTTGGTSFELIALPGVYVEPTIDARFIVSADALLLVVDPQIERIEANRSGIETMIAARRSHTFGAVVFTKQDLRGRGTFVEPSALLAYTVAADWPVFYSRIDEPHTVLLGIDWLIGRLLGSSA